MADRLNVLLLGGIAGRLDRDRAGQMRFTYAPDYRGTTPLSPALPVSDRSFRDVEIRPFLEGLLPDNVDVRLRWANIFGTTDDPFNLLARMGHECAGGVQFATDENLDEIRNQVGDLVPLVSSDIGRRLRELRQSRSGETWTMPAEHWSLAGAQGKFTLAWVDGRWCEARGASPSTHILKPGVFGMRLQAAVEFATMRAARRLGLSVADVEFGEFDGEQAVVIKRFDRTSAGGAARRLHQVDLCQAVGSSPTSKYEMSGGPKARDLAQLIGRTSALPDTDVARFSDALLFNYLSGSPDGHAKNFALIYAGNLTRLAPLYDLATGLPYDKRDSPPFSAFAIGGVRNFGEAYPKHWIAHAREFGLDPDERTVRVRQLAAEIPDAFRDSLHKDLGGADGVALWKRLTERPGRLLSHCARVEQRLNR